MTSERTMTSGRAKTSGERSVRPGCLGVVFLTVLCLSLVPSVFAASVSGSQGYGDPSAGWLSKATNFDGVPYSPKVAKRNKGVDAWSICPPHMTDVDCFYAYLRVYARLRKAAEESDRVSMRNIGKRSSLTSPPSEAERERSRLRRLPLCPDNMPPALCYLSAKNLYRRVLQEIDTRL